MLCQFDNLAKHQYVMVRRLPNRLIGECSGYFKSLRMVYLFVNVFVHQNVKDFISDSLVSE